MKQQPDEEKRDFGPAIDRRMRFHPVFQEDPEAWRLFTLILFNMNRKTEPFHSEDSQWSHLAIQQGEWRFPVDQLGKLLKCRGSHNKTKPMSRGMAERIVERLVQGGMILTRVEKAQLRQPVKPSLRDQSTRHSKIELPNQSKNRWSTVFTVVDLHRWIRLLKGDPDDGTSQKDDSTTSQHATQTVAKRPTKTREAVISRRVLKRNANSRPNSSVSVLPVPVSPALPQGDAGSPDTERMEFDLDELPGKPPAAAKPPAPVPAETDPDDHVLTLAWVRRILPLVQESLEALGDSSRKYLERETLESITLMLQGQGKRRYGLGMALDAIQLAHYALLSGAPEEDLRAAVEFGAGEFTRGNAFPALGKLRHLWSSEKLEEYASAARQQKAAPKSKQRSLDIPDNTSPEVERQRRAAQARTRQRCLAALAAQPTGDS